MSFDTKDREKIEERTQENREGYDYRLHFPDASTADRISFLVLGDSGAGGAKKRAKYLVADAMADEKNIDLILHVGDLVYLSGAKEGYPDRFIGPYHHWLKNGKNHDYDDMVFNTPFLPVYGNHDYYDFKKAIPIPLLRDVIGALFNTISNMIGSGSKNGEVFEEAFVETNPNRITHGALPYISGEQTRIPNRYYWFTYGPCAFFALDSNTLDMVANPSMERREEMEQALEKTKEIIKKRLRQIEKYRDLRQRLEANEIDAEQVEGGLDLLVDDLAEQEKRKAMLQKYLDRNAKDADKDYDAKQLEWFERVLRHEEVQDKWKIVYFHHPLYSSDASHTDDPQSVGMRENLRRILIDGKVNLVLNGHSHCFEWLMPVESNNEASEEEQDLAKQERNICYIVTGGGGRKLRISILEEKLKKVPPTTLRMTIEEVDERDKVIEKNEEIRKKQFQFLDVAESKAYTALFGPKNEDPVHHYLLIDADANKLLVTPIGIEPHGANAASPHSPIPTKVITGPPKSIVIDESKKLKSIQVYRDREPKWL